MESPHAQACRGTSRGRLVHEGTPRMLKHFFAAKGVEDYKVIMDILSKDDA